MTQGSTRRQGTGRQYAHSRGAPADARPPQELDVGVEGAFY
jgi:hypothetical protein